MRISDWSSDVCSSDLSPNCGRTCEPAFLRHKRHCPAADVGSKRSVFPESLLSHLPPRGSRRQGYSEWRRNQPSLAAPIRSEEHTSELQSLMRLSYAVFCLKKKKYETK